MISLSMYATEKGPLTNGQAVRAADDYVQDVPKVVARTGARYWVALLMQFIRVPTPYYWTTIRAMPAGAGWVVRDGNVVYGPWLEGEGSRNRGRPGFPGYRARRKATQRLDGEAGTIAYDLLNRIYIDRMN
jgi:hypothetical protein